MNTNSIVSIYSGTQSCQIGYCLNFLQKRSFYPPSQSEQIFQEDDLVNHQCLFQDVQNRTPRALFFDWKNQIGALKYINNCNMKKDKQKVEEQRQGLWGQNFQIKVDQEEQKQSEEKKVDLEGEYDLLFKKTVPQKSQLVELTNEFDIKTDVLTNGEMILKIEENNEKVQESLRKILEENDYVASFNNVADIDTVYGGLNLKFLQLIQDECPQQKIMTFGIYDSYNVSKQPTSSILEMNKIIGLSKYSEITSSYTPLDLNRLGYLKIFDTKMMESSEFCKRMAAATILSNVTLPYRLKDVSGIEEILHQIIPEQRINIFNIACNVPQLTPDLELLDQSQYIINFKAQLPNYATSEKILIHNKDWNSFGQSFMLRGDLKLPKIEPKTYGFDFHMIDTILCLTPEYPNMIEKSIIQMYANQREELDIQKNEKILVVEDHLESLPFHTCLFSHQNYKFNLKNMLNSFKSTEKNIKLKFYEGNYSEEEIKEIENDVEMLFDCYNKHSL